jgi:hypothetical protein
LASASRRASGEVAASTVSTARPTSWWTTSLVSAIVPSLKTSRAVVLCSMRSFPRFSVVSPIRYRRFNPARAGLMLGAWRQVMV